MRQDESLKLRPRFNALIPGGCHTYAKGDDCRGTPDSIRREAQS
jgi:hypothetical protein